jgi:hypothetical protein
MLRIPHAISHSFAVFEHPPRFSSLRNMNFDADHIDDADMQHEYAAERCRAFVLPYHYAARYIRAPLFISYCRYFLSAPPLPLVCRHAMPALLLRYHYALRFIIIAIITCRLIIMPLPACRPASPFTLFAPISCRRHTAVVLLLSPLCHARDATHHAAIIISSHLSIPHCYDEWSFSLPSFCRRPILPSLATVIRSVMLSLAIFCHLRHFRFAIYALFSAKRFVSLFYC